MLNLAKVLGLSLPPLASPEAFTQEMLLHSLTNLLNPSSRPSQPLTDILASLEIAISQLRDEDSEEEEPPKKETLRQNDRKEKGRKKNNEKKKAKKGRQSALEEIQSKAMADSMCERVELAENIKKIEMLKEFLERKMLLDLCQQSMLHLTSTQVYA